MNVFHLHSIEPGDVSACQLARAMTFYYDPTINLSADVTVAVKLIKLGLFA
jgi:hypothetical protein